MLYLTQCITVNVFVWSYHVNDKNYPNLNTPNIHLYGDKLVCYCWVALMDKTNSNIARIYNSFLAYVWYNTQTTKWSPFQWIWIYLSRNSLRQVMNLCCELMRSCKYYIYNTWVPNSADQFYLYKQYHPYNLNNNECVMNIRYPIHLIVTLEEYYRVDIHSN